MRAGRRAGHLPSLAVTPADLAPAQAQAIMTKFSASTAPAPVTVGAQKEREGEREGESIRLWERRTEGRTEVRKFGERERERERERLRERKKRSERGGRDA